MDKCLPVGALDLFQSSQRGKSEPQNGPTSPPIIIEDMSLFYYRQLAESLKVNLSFFFHFLICYEKAECGSFCDKPFIMVYSHFITISFCEKHVLFCLLLASYITVSSSVICTRWFT